MTSARVAFTTTSSSGTEARKSHPPCTLNLSDWTQRTAEGPLQEMDMRIFYERNPIQVRGLRVIPAANIITGACLAPCFQDGVSHYHTILHWFQVWQRHIYPSQIRVKGLWGPGIWIPACPDQNQAPKTASWFFNFVFRTLIYPSQLHSQPGDWAPSRTLVP